MTIKSYFLAVLLLTTSSLHANGLYTFSNQPLSINQCNIDETNNPLDLALINDGYFVISLGKKNSELLFTRYGRLMFNKDKYIITERGYYLLGINKKSDPNKLTKFKISTLNMPPKATSRVDMIINLPHKIAEGDYVQTSVSIYDSLSVRHPLTVVYTRINSNTWNVQVSVDDIKLNKGTLIFKNDGSLSKQEGLSHIQWPTDYGLNELKINYSGSTAYATPFEVQLTRNNGYPLGKLTALSIDNNGVITLLYTNGEAKPFSNQIAVAKFANPSYLQLVTANMYRPTEQSGPQRLHRINSEFAIVSGYLEQESCLKS